MSEKDIIERLDKISRKIDMLIGAFTIQGKDDKQEIIKILYSLGLTSKTINQLTGIPEGTIRRIKSTKLKIEKGKK
jgi:hypothetical protein